ncbi:MAG: hypothetical protein ABI809_14040 [Caldimonas sp.]
MPRSSTLSSRSGHQRFVAWLLACLIPLQGIAAGVIGAAGPLHVHRATAASELVLTDFRRASAQSTAPSIVHVASAFGHFHAGGKPLRHPHSRADRSVVAAPGEAQAGAADESTLSPTLLVLVAPIPHVPVWAATTQREAFVARPSWRSLTHDPEPFERPPRAV